MPYAFLAYNRDDRRIMEPLRDYLRNRGIDVWTDEHLAPNAPNYHREIENQIRNCHAFIVLMSPSANAEDSYVQNEIGFALRIHKPIYPILVSGEEDNSIPISLINFQFTDLRGRVQQSVDEAYNYLAHSIAQELGVEIESPTSSQIRVTVQGDVVGSLNVAGERITINRLLSAPTIRWIVMAIIGAIVIMIGFSLRESIEFIAQATQEIPNTPPATIFPTETEAPENAELAQVITVITATMPPTFTPTDEPTLILTATPSPVPTSRVEPDERVIQEGVSTNDDWTPYIRSFLGVEMALVPGGCFTMGSHIGEDDEQPVHEVCLAPFWVDIYEVSNLQYGSTASGNDDLNNSCEAISSTDYQPRICITWDLAVDHCKKRDARLPTEAEWEYAASGPDGSVYPWGFELETDYAVSVENSRGRVSVVHSHTDGQSWIGAHHMSGNVFEWVTDWYDTGYYNSSPRIDPQGPREGSVRVLRGGSWVTDVDSLRSANRNEDNPNYTFNNVGFRCAREYDS